MSSTAVLIATAKLQPGRKTDFLAWETQRAAVLAKFPGFISTDVIPPTSPDSNEWTIFTNFQSGAALTAWKDSPDCASVLAGASSFLEGGTLHEVADGGTGGSQAGADVTEVIFSKVRSGQEDEYREWAARIQAKQADSPGYRGTYLQPPGESGGIWTTIIRFDSAAHLETWMNSPERTALIKESRAYIEHEQMTRLATSFPGWVPVDPATGKGPPNWKTALLVLLGLFPVVMLELRFLNPVLTGAGLNSSFATFLGNSLSVAATSFITMPVFIRWFGWWLFLKDDSPGHTTLKGVMLLIVLFALEVGVLWRLLPS